MGENKLIINQENNSFLPTTNIDDLSIPQAGEKTYRLANIYRIMFARLFDLLLSAIPGIVINSVLMSKPENIGNWPLIIGVLVGTFVWTIIYFVILPLFFHGNTFGKLILNIRLKRKSGNKKISFWMLMIREAYFTFIPWLVVVIAQVIAVAIMGNYQDETLNQSPGLIAASLVINLANIFYILWLSFVAVTIKIQQHHQASIDLKFHLFVVNKIAIEDEMKTVTSKSKKIQRTDEHVSLTDQPGNFDQTVLNDLHISVEDEIKASIYLDKDNLVEDLMIEKAKKELIETKEQTKKEETIDE